MCWKVWKSWKITQFREKSIDVLPKYLVIFLMENLLEADEARKICWDILIKNYQWPIGSRRWCVYVYECVCRCVCVCVCVCVYVCVCVFWKLGIIGLRYWTLIHVYKKIMKILIFCCFFPVCCSRFSCFQIILWSSQKFIQNNQRVFSMEINGVASGFTMISSSNGIHRFTTKPARDRRAKSCVKVFKKGNSNLSWIEVHTKK